MTVMRLLGTQRPFLLLLHQCLLGGLPFLLAGQRWGHHPPQ